MATTPGTPGYQLSRPDLIKSLRWLSAQATDQRDMLCLSLCLRMLVSDTLQCTELLILAAIECGWQTREELVDLTGRCDKTVRMVLYKLQGEGRVKAFQDEQRRKIYRLTAT